MGEDKNIIIYQSGEIELKVSVDNDTIWLSTENISKLFDVQRPAIVKHIGNIYKTNELSRELSCSILEQLTKNISKQFQLDFRKYQEQYPHVTLKEFKDTHDRFLILDEKDVYHFGASLKDLGKKWFVFSKMDISSVKILDKLKKEDLI